MHPSLLSPDVETFSTPPTTPGPSNIQIRPSLSRRTSRPSSIHTEFSKADWNPAVSIERVSPEVGRAIGNGHVSALATPKVPPSPSPPPSRHPRMNGAQFKFSPPNSTAGSSNEDEEDHGGTLTEQLAETAVGVREMSKQLGRACARSNIQNVLIITKARDNRLIKLTRELALYLMIKHRNGQARGLVVYVDNQLRNSRRFDAVGIKRDHPELFVPYPRRRSSSSNSLSSLSSVSVAQGDFQLVEEGQLRYWTSDMCSQTPHLFDFVITLGGDGTVLFTSWLFQRIVPPVLPFSLGSLGFLTNFDFADHQTVMDSVIDSGIRVNLRMRFTCTVYRAVALEPGKGRKAVKKGETGEIMMKNVEKGGWEALEGGWSGAHSNIVPEGGKCRDKEIMCFTTRAAESFEVLNDLVVDRGPSPYVSLLELFGDEHHMTTVQADGLTVSTPTGSTAYSLSAGGSLVHPQIPAILITPICPHTLSFRPMLLPDSMELRICVPFNSRSTAWASFDGRGRVELRQGDHIKVTASKYPFPTVCADKQSTDWFHSISRTLKWNERERQKSFVVVEEGPAKPKKISVHRMTISNNPDQLVTPSAPELVEEALEDEDEDEVSDEDEDKFDIDDSSPEAAASKLKNEEALGKEKADEVAHLSIDNLVGSLSPGHTSKRRSKSKSRSRSRSSGLRSGVDTPGRYAGPQPHPPRIVQHHNDSVTEGQQDMRDSRTAFMSGKSKIPVDLELMKTPTISDTHGRRGHTHVRSSSIEHHPHRAFAVWGQDESDSNASDSDQ